MIETRRRVGQYGAEVTTIKLSASRKYAHKYTVGGHYTFPVDMLRYDASFPSRSEDASAIVHSLDGSSSNYVEVVLVHHDERADWSPTLDRWRSFGWTVIR